MSNLKFTPSSFANVLASATTKLNFANLLISALGATRTLRAFKDVNAGAADPYLTGTEFLTATMTGTITSSAGNLQGFGTVDSISKQIATDLSTGSCILRIEGNGNAIQGTLGPIGGNTDFFCDNLTATSGIGFSPSAGILAPRLLPSGTGPAAPQSTLNSPSTLEIWNWQNTASPVLVGSLTFNNRISDFVFQDAEMATEMGDVRITQSTQSIVYGEFEFGAIWFSAHAGINSETNLPLDQVLVGCKPYGRWSSYPFDLTYNADVDGTFPKPFKAILKRADGTVLKTFEMHDGLAINDPSLQQSLDPAQLKPIRPGFNCGMLLPWQSHVPKPSSNLGKYNNGVTAQSRRPSQGKGGIAINGTFPLAWGRFQGNAMTHWWGAPRWSLSQNTDYDMQPDQEDPEGFTDPYLFYGDQRYHAYEGRIWRLQGWDYEPGATGCHDWYNGPGGPRADRCTFPTVIDMYVSEPTGARLKGTVPYKTLNTAWGLNYFNHAHHYLTDVKTFATQPDEYFYQGRTSYSQAYYGYRNDYAPGGLGYHVGLRSIANGSDWPPLDKDGRHHWNGWAIDNQHAYCAPGLMTMLFNSPMHAYSHKLRAHAVSMSQLGGISLGGASGPGDFLHRQFSWRMLTQVVAWKLAANHSLGFNRESVERRLQTEFEAVYDQVYKPAMIDNSQDVLLAGFRNLGCGTLIKDSGNGLYVGKHDDFKTFYFNRVLVLLRQTGLWAVLRARSAKCATVLDFIIACHDKHAIDNLYYTFGRIDGQLSAIAAVGVTPAIPASWEEVAAQIPRQGIEDALHTADGTVNRNFVGEPATSNMRMQYVMMRRDFFPEYPHPHLTAVCTMIQGWYDEIEARVNAASTPPDKAGKDWEYWIPPQGILKPPTVLGPA